MQVDTTNTMGNAEAERREHRMEKLLLNKLQDSSEKTIFPVECGGRPDLGKEPNDTPSPSSASVSSSYSPSENASAAAISTSEMQASFAERTATEMEQIVNWYKIYEGDERLKTENQQRRSMPDNAFVVDDHDDDDHDGSHDGSHDNDEGEEEKEDHDATDDGHRSTLEHVHSGTRVHQSRGTSECDVVSSDPLQPEHEKIVIHDDESVLVKDFYTPSQSSRNSKTIIRSNKKKKSRSLLFKAVRSVARSISKASVTRSVVSRTDENDDEHNALHDCEVRDLPPRAIKIVIPDDDESSVISSLTTPVFEKRKLPLNHPLYDGKLDSYLLRSETADGIDAESTGKQLPKDHFDDAESTVSPDRCHEPQDLNIIESTEQYHNAEKELLAMLSSTNIECCATSLQQNDCGTSYIGTIAEHPSDEDEGADAEVPDFMDHCESTKQQAHDQIEATEDLIRNTQNMAEIIAQLQQSSQFSFHDVDEDSDDNHQSGFLRMSDNINNEHKDEHEVPDDDSIASIETPSLSSEMLALWELEGNADGFAAEIASRTDAGGSIHGVGHKPNHTLLGLHPRNYGSPVASSSSRSSLSTFVGWVWRK